MSRFDLRDVSERLTKSRTVESVISEFLSSLESMRQGWHASLAFYEVSEDSLVDVYEIDHGRIVRRNIVVPVDSLPHRLVRQIFQATAFPAEYERGLVVTQAGGASHYLADAGDASALMPLTVLSDWASCICLPLGYQDDLIALLVLVSTKKNAFAGKALAEVMPLKSIATVALAQHLYRSQRQRAATAAPPPAKSEAASQASEAWLEDAKLKEEMDLLGAQSERLDRENRNRSAEIESLVEQIETLDRSSNRYKEELERVKTVVSAMEESSEAAVEFLTEAYHALQTTRWTLDELELTVAVLKDVFDVLAGDLDHEMLPEIIVDWFCTRLEIARCSLLVPDATGETLQMAAYRGVDPQVAARVRVRVGQGVAGWVAAHRKPLFVRVREDAQVIPRSGDGTYNSDSFIVAPLAHNGRLHGVVNLSNRLDGEGFGQADLDRVLLAASAFAATLGGQQVARRAAAWA
jgi:transcriptional regulator with GAF, ATPase, and Fis domain